MSSESSNNVYYQTIDVEAVSNTRVSAIGLFCCDKDGVQVTKEEWWIKTKPEDFDPACKGRHWDANPQLLRRLEDEGKNEADQIKDFITSYDSLAQFLGVQESDVRLVSDNPEFDYGRLTPYVEKHCKREPIRYTTYGHYRSIADYGDAIDKLGLYGIIKKQVDRIQKHNHFPSDDAEHIVLSHLVHEAVLDVIAKGLESDLKHIAEHISETKVNSIIAARENAVTPNQLSKRTKSNNTKQTNSHMDDLPKVTYNKDQLLLVIQKWDKKNFSYIKFAMDYVDKPNKYDWTMLKLMRETYKLPTIEELVGLYAKDK